MASLVLELPRTESRHIDKHVYLAYIDDSGTGDKGKPFQLMTAVVIDDSFFRMAEIFSVGSLHAHIPEDKAEAFWGKFEEFKGWELFGGYGPFDGIDQEIRFSIIKSLLSTIRECKLPVIFGALEKGKLKRSVYGSVLPLDVCFRTCIEGIDRFMTQGGSNSFALLIADESNKEKTTLRESFFEYRQRMRPAKDTPFPNFHDDMYFGDSKYSVGLQLADVCGYVISKRLQKDIAVDGFLDIIDSQIMFSRIEPEGRDIHQQIIDQKMRSGL